MDGQISFLEKFKKYSPKEEYRKILEKVSDYRIRTDKERKMIETFASFPEIVEKRILYDIESEICEAYQINSMRILPSYPPGAFFRAVYTTACYRGSAYRSGIKGLFESYSAKLDGKRIVIEIGFSNGGIELLYKAETPQLLSGIIKSEFGLDYEVEIKQEEGYSFDYAGYEREQAKALLDIPADNSFKRVEKASVEIAENEKPVSPKYSPLLGTDLLEAKQTDEGYYRIGNSVFDTSSPSYILGTEFDISDPVPVRNIEILKTSMRRVCILGVAYAIETKETRKGDKTIINFALTDDDYSIFCKTILPAEEAGGFISKLKEGKAYAVCGSVRIDKFDGEFILSPLSVAEIQKIERSDNAPQKRVELHLHTQMSAMDGLIPPDAAVRTAYTWGHPAVAITDHGNVQGYQDAMLVADKTGMKVIYGMEAYFVDDTARSVYGDSDADFSSSEFIVFDIETTGLSALNDRITEIGAVLVRGGEVLDVFNTFADPGIPIPVSITELTGITDDMVKGAPSQEEAVRAFLDFAGGRTLIAHNAGFDTSFIRKVCDDFGIPFSNTYLDTVALSRYVNPELKKHKLDTLANYFGLGDFNHHRASDDAEMLALIFFKMVEKLSEEGIKSLSAMTSAMADKVDCLKLKTYHMIILVKNKIGLKNLYKLVSFSYLNYYKKHPRIPKTVLDNYREGLIIGSACSEGELFNAMLENRPRADLLGNCVVL